MITGIIMAAGFSKRMGQDKLLMEIDGIKMIERVIKSCIESSLDEIILIYRKEEVKEIGEKYGIRTIYNPNAHLGQSESMKLGLNAAINEEAYMFLMGDQPFITGQLIDRLITEYKKSQYPIVVPYYNGRNGTPTIFSAMFKDDLLKVEGDKGGRDIIKTNFFAVNKVIIDNEKLGFDMDTSRDFRGVMSLISLLHEIEEDVRKYAEVISNVIKVDVEIVDENMRRVAGTGIFKDQIGQVNKGSVYKKVIDTGEPQIIKNPREHEICKDCISRDSCIEKLEISTPIIYEDKIIGVIGLVCSTDEQKQIILEKLDSQIQFLHQIGDFISSKVYQHNESKVQEERTEVLNKILNNVDKGVIVLDTDNKITMLNNSAMRELKLFSKDLNKEVKIVDKDEYIMGGELYEIIIDKKRFLLVGNIIPIHSISKSYAKVFIFNNMNKINSDIYNITTSEKRINLDTIIGESKAMKILKEKIKRIASTQSTVLITGESGTGKELVARAIHDLSDRRHKPFVAVNCSAMPEALMESELFGYVKGAFTGANANGKIGKFELANGGVILLDEIGDMPLYMQVKLLRVLQERTVTRIGSNQPIDLDIRVLAATNLDLEQRIKENKFREDLYYRLNVIPIEVPPLRKREGDIELIVNKLIDKYNILFDKYIHGIEDECKEILLNYSWPGNVRELQNTIEYMINIADKTGILTKDMLPDNILGGNDLVFHNNKKEIKTLEEVEREYIQKALYIYGETTEGKKIAAEKLGIGIATLYRKIKK